MRDYEWEAVREDPVRARTVISARLADLTARLDDALAETEAIDQAVGGLGPVGPLGRAIRQRAAWARLVARQAEATLEQGDYGLAAPASRYMRHLVASVEFRLSLIKQAYITTAAGSGGGTDADQ